MKRLLSVLVVTILLFLTASPVLASIYSATLTIIEANGISYAMLPSMSPSANSWMATNGFMEASALDTRVSTLGGLNKPWMVTDNMTLTAVPVIANSQTNLYFTTGNTDATAFNIITGWNGYITFSDAPNLEWSDNGTATFTAWVDTTAGASKSLLEKSGAFSANVSSTVSGNITSTIYGGASRNLTLAPAGAGFYTQAEVFFGAATHWQTQLTNDGYTSYIEATTNNRIDSYTTNFTSLISDATINYVTVYTQASRKLGTGVQRVYTFMRLSGTDSTSASHNPADTTFTLFSDNFSRPGGGTWVASDFSNLEIGVKLDDNGAGGQTFSTQVYAIINYTVPDHSLTLTGIAAGAHTVTPGINTPFFGQSVDSTLYLPIRTNLVANLPLWETSINGTSFNTIDSNWYAATSNATWSSTSGRTFNGTTTVTLTNIWAGLSSNTAGTIDIWAKLPDATPAADMALVSFADTNAIEWMSVRVNTTGKVYVDFYDAGAVQWIFTSDNPIFADNTWVNIILVQNATSPVLYANGSLVPITFNSSVNTTRWFSVLGGVDNAFLGKLYMNSVDNQIPLTGDIGDARFYSSAFTATNALRNYNGSVWKYNGSTTMVARNTMATVINNSANWTLDQGNSMPYMTSFTMSVNGTEQLWYQPVSMIIGNALPDRDGADNNGVFTWGSNPAGITATLGSLLSVAQPTPIISTDRETRDLLPPAGTSDWFVDPDISGALLTNPLRPLVTIMSDTTTLTERQAWVFMGGVFVLLVAVGVGSRVRGHHLITGIAVAAAIYALCAMTIWPWWSLMGAAFAILAGMVAERMQSI